MPAVGTQGFLHTDLASALGHGYQHDVHQPHATDAERQQADEAQQDLDSCGDHVQIEQICENVEDKDCALVFRIERMMECHGVPERFYHLSVIAHRAERHVNMLVQIFVAVVDYFLQDS